LKDIQARTGLAIIFITHDFGIVARMCDRVAVMYLGKIVEIASAEQLYARPLHPYTRALLAAVPPIGKGKEKFLVPGDVPNPADPPAGCSFHPRCPLKESRCETSTPELREIAPGHKAACHLI
ncbi:MAG: ABC transporter ATP-binding protein, partial [Nitrospinae bacterium]|nr:ABC transporter ATP-binding protein [Nitrospinota bacterium]